MLFDIRNIISDALESEWLQQKEVSITVARLDNIHPVVSGNKLFKLHYFLEAFKTGNYKWLQTFGGAYSNHLVATAFACRESGIPCEGIVRGEEPPVLSPTLMQCKDYGMELTFVSREDYAAMAGTQESAAYKLVVPEGGYHPLGAKGASLIMDIIPGNFSHTCLPAGTATTLAGILQQAGKEQAVIAIPVLKGLNDLEERLTILNGKRKYDNLTVWNDFHFGGYAKKTPALLEFMNDLFRKYGLPTDFVYTGKMMYAVFDAISTGRIPAGSKVLCLHTGGLQGNDSLPAGTLVF